MINKRYWVEESYLTSMADVIRNKTGKTDKILFPDGFFDEIANIETTPATALPVLDSNYPEDVTVVEGVNINANFNIVIAEPGIPAIYTYQWYENGNPIEGATSSIYNKTTDFVVGNYSIYCEITNEAGTVISRIANFTIESYLPTYTYTGNSTLIEDGNYNWRIKFLTTGDLTFTSFGNINTTGIDCFLAGAGGGGHYSSSGGGGGGGGYVTTKMSIPIELNTKYSIAIGGVALGGRGGTSSAFNLSAAGGYPGSGYVGGNGGSGGGGGTGYHKAGAVGGSNGANGGVGNSDYGPGGTGTGTTTREFGESTGTLYCGGGSGANQSSRIDETCGAGGANGTTNRGGGGGGKKGYTYGGSGIVVIRNHR